MSIALIANPHRIGRTTRGVKSAGPGLCVPHKHKQIYKRETFIATISTNVSLQNKKIKINFNFKR